MLGDTATLPTPLVMAAAGLATFTVGLELLRPPPRLRPGLSTRCRCIYHNDVSFFVFVFFFLFFSETGLRPHQSRSFSIVYNYGNFSNS